MLCAGIVLAGLACDAGQPAQPAPLVNARDWKRLRKHAHTAGEFRACAQWCRIQAEGYSRTEAEYEGEMQELRSRPPNHEGPRYPPTSEHLRTEIAHYKGLVRHWNDLAASYDKRAAAAHN